MNLGEWEVIAAKLDAFDLRNQAKPETYALYFDMLKEFDADIVDDAVCRHIKQSKWFPAVSELREICEPEQQVRNFYSLLPDFTGCHALTNEEYAALAKRGMDARKLVEGESVPALEGDRPMLERGEGW